MVIQQTIDNINKKPLHIRKYIAYGITGASALLLFGLWVVSLASTRLDITSTDLNAISADDVAVLGQGINTIIENADIDSFQAGLQNRQKPTTVGGETIDPATTLYDESYPLPSTSVPTAETVTEYPWEQ